MKYTLTISDMTEQEMLQVQSKLHGVVIGKLETTEEEAPIKSTKKKTTKKAKVEEPVEEEATEEELDDEDDFGYDPDEEENEDEESDEDESKISKDDVMTAFKTYYQKIVKKSKDKATGVKAARAETQKILKKLKAKAVESIKPNQYATALKLLK